MILNVGGLDALLQAVNRTSNHLIIKNGIWTITNLCRGKPLPPVSLVESCIPTLCAAIKRETDTEILTDAAWGLTYISKNEAQIQQIINTGIIPSLINLVEYIF